MKKLNLLSLLTILFTLLSSQNIVAAEDGSGLTQEGTTWYTTTYSSEHNLGYNTDPKNLNINLYYPSNYVSFEAKMELASTGNRTIFVDQYIDGWDNIAHTTENISTSYKTYETDDVSPNATMIAIGRPKAGTLRRWVRNIKVRMAPHIRINNLMHNDLGEVLIGETKSIEIDFKSFLTSGNLTVTTDNPNFLINGKDTKITLCEGNTLEKLDENTKNFQVVYRAISAGTESTNVTIKDEGNQNSVTIKIIATCVKKSNTINWNGINTQIAIEESVSLDNVTATSNGDITFTSSDPTIIKVENNKLVALTEGVATITAQVAENDEYQAAESTLEFEATQKTIQNIVWKQDFYLLKVGDADITLNAKAADKETGFENGNLIEYSVAEGGESVVTITDGVLHIVGKGQTSIIAHQRGDETYAATFLKKTVIVREVSDECNNNYALVVTEAKEEGCDVLCGFSTQSFRVTHQLATRGDKLSFITDCTDATVSREVKVTDQNGRTIYDGGFGEVKDLQLNKDVTALTFFVQGNFRIRLSNIFVTQASYLETTTENINFAGSEIGKTGVAEVVFYWQNQPDMMWATIENDSADVFSVDQNTYIFGGTCGEYGTSTVKTIFNPEKSGNYSANLVIYRGEGANTKKMTIIPITATAIKTPQFITWAQDLVALNPALGGTYELGATASSGLPVYYTSSDENIARIENNKLVVVGAGVVTITAKQDGNLNYEPATAVEKTITIAKLNQTITWNQEFTSDLTIGSTVELSASTTSGETVEFISSNEAVATIAGNTLTIIGVGEATITARQSGNNNYNAATEVSKTLSIAKLNQTITWTQDLSHLLIGATETLNATASSGLEITYSSDNASVASINGTTITINGEGSVKITATQAGNNTYHPISVEKTFTFGRTAQTITWNDDLSALAINDVVTLTATSDANLEITYTIDNAAVATIEGNTLTIIGAGEANITAQQPGNETYNSASVVKSINIAHFTQTIDWAQDLSTLTLESQPLELNATATSGLNVVYTSSNTNVATIEGNILTIVGAGETTITARQTGNNQYSAVEMTQTLSIAKLTQTIVWEQDLSNVTLLEDFITLTAEATSGLTVIYTSSDESVIQINGNIISIIAEGEATITATQAGNNKYEAAEAIEKTIVVTKQTQEIIWDQNFADLDFYDYPYELTAYSTSGLKVTYELDATSTEKAMIEDNYLYPFTGDCFITIYAYQEGNDKYQAAQYIEKTVFISTNEITTNIAHATTTLLYADNVVYFNGTHQTLRIFDMAGRQVYSADVTGENQHHIALQRGIYIICLDNQRLKIITK